VFVKLLQTPLDMRLTEFFAATSVPLAHGHNIVNVILVDFRGLDTLGEIAVVMTAGVSILALIRIRAGGPQVGIGAPKKSAKRKPAKSKKTASKKRADKKQLDKPPLVEKAPRSKAASKARANVKATAASKPKVASKPKAASKPKVVSKAKPRRKPKAPVKKGVVK